MRNKQGALALGLNFEFIQQFYQAIHDGFALKIFFSLPNCAIYYLFCSIFSHQIAPNQGLHKMKLRVLAYNVNLLAMVALHIHIFLFKFRAPAPKFKLD